MDYREKSELAFNSLEKETQYSKDKYLIHSFFSDNEIPLTKTRIITQLTIIDSYYSTNMSHRYYGIEEVSDSLIRISTNKKTQKQKFIDYTSLPDNNKDITELFRQDYGYNKSGNKYGQAMSLISKYAYFTTDFQFPIYDSIVREVYPLIIKNRRLSNTQFDLFIKQMRELLEFTNIENFNKLDNLLWLIGKINRGNYSLILEKKKYCELVKKIPGLENLKSDKIDDEIRSFIDRNINNLTDIFSKDQIKMIQFSLDLKKNKNET